MGRVYEGETIDLSRGGVKLHVDAMPAMGALVNIEIRAPDATLYADGRVVWSDLPNKESQRPPSLAVAFSHLEPDTEKALNTLLIGLVR